MAVSAAMVNSATTLVAGSLLALLGLWLIATRVRNRGAVWFSFFCIGFGASIAILPFEPTQGTTGWTVWESLRVGARFLYVGGIAGTFVHVPIPLRPRERAPFVAFAIGAVGWLLFSSARAVVDPEFRVLGAPTILQGADLLASRLSSATVLGTLLGLAFRFPTLPDRAARRSVAFLTIGLVLFSTGNAGALARDPTPGAIASVVGLLACAIAWLLHTGGPDGRMARNVAIAIPACLLANMLMTIVLPEFRIPGSRLIAVAFLSYAVLGGLIAGLDAKLHFAISKGTVAAIFVVVFFVASELAQQFFAQRYSAMAGIVAAGMLVFALAPLQRAAERFAERAVPLDAHPAHGRRPSAQASDVYKAALRAAMRDGIITRREEKHLAEVARGLGLDPVQAHELRDEVEGEPPART